LRSLSAEKAVEAMLVGAFSVDVGLRPFGLDIVA